MISKAATGTVVQPGIRVLPAWLKFPMGRKAISPAGMATVAGRSCGGSGGAGARDSRSASTPASAVTASNGSNSIDFMIAILSRTSGAAVLHDRPALPGLPLGSEPGEFGRRQHLFHQVVVPIALDHHMARRAKVHRLDQVVVHIGVDTRLQELIERRPGGTAANEPGFKVAFGRVVELARLPDQVAMPADQVGPRVAVGLAMDEENLFALLGLERVIPGQRADCAVEYNVTGDQPVHQIDRISVAFADIGKAHVAAIGVLRDIVFVL